MVLNTEAASHVPETASINFQNVSLTNPHASAVDSAAPSGLADQALGFACCCDACDCTTQEMSRECLLPKTDDYIPRVPHAPFIICG